MGNSAGTVRQSEKEVIKAKRECIVENVVKTYPPIPIVNARSFQSRPSMTGISRPRYEPGPSRISCEWPWSAAEDPVCPWSWECDARPSWECVSPLIVFGDEWCMCQYVHVSMCQFQ